MINHAFIKNTSADTHPSGIKTIKGYLDVSTRMNGFLVLYKGNEGRTTATYRGFLKNSRVKIFLDQKYDHPEYNVIVLYTGNMISLMIMGNNNIKLTINGKTYVADVVLLSSSNAMIRGMLSISKYDGSSIRITSRGIAINGIYDDQTHINDRLL